MIFFKLIIFSSVLQYAANAMAVTTEVGDSSAELKTDSWRSKRHGKPLYFDYLNYLIDKHALHADEQLEEQKPHGVDKPYEMYVLPDGTAINSAGLQEHMQQVSNVSPEFTSLSMVNQNKNIFPALEIYPHEIYPSLKPFIENKGVLVPYPTGDLVKKPICDSNRCRAKPKPKLRYKSQERKGGSKSLMERNRVCSCGTFKKTGNGKQSCVSAENNTKLDSNTANISSVNQIMINQSSKNNTTHVIVLNLGANNCGCSNFAVKSPDHVETVTVVEGPGHSVGTPAVLPGHVSANVSPPIAVSSADSATRLDSVLTLAPNSAPDLSSHHVSEPVPIMVTEYETSTVSSIDTGTVSALATTFPASGISTPTITPPVMPTFQSSSAPGGSSADPVQIFVLVSTTLFGSTLGSEASSTAIPVSASSSSSDFDISSTLPTAPSLATTLNPSTTSSPAKGTDLDIKIMLTSRSTTASISALTSILDSATSTSPTASAIFSTSVPDKALISSSADGSISNSATTLAGSPNADLALTSIPYMSLGPGSTSGAVSDLATAFISTTPPDSALKSTPHKMSEPDAAKTSVPAPAFDVASDPKINLTSSPTPTIDLITPSDANIAVTNSVTSPVRGSTLISVPDASSDHIPASSSALDSSTTASAKFSAPVSGSTDTGLSTATLPSSPPRIVDPDPDSAIKTELDPDSDSFVLSADLKHNYVANFSTASSATRTFGSISVSSIMTHPVSTSSTTFPDGSSSVPTSGINPTAAPSFVSSSTLNRELDPPVSDPGSFYVLGLESNSTSSSVTTSVPGLFSPTIPTTSFVADSGLTTVSESSPTSALPATPVSNPPHGIGPSDMNPPSTDTSPPQVMDQMSKPGTNAETPRSTPLVIGTSLPTERSLAVTSASSSVIADMSAAVTGSSFSSVPGPIATASSASVSTSRSSSSFVTGSSSEKAAGSASDSGSSTSVASPALITSSAIDFSSHSYRSFVLSSSLAALNSSASASSSSSGFVASSDRVSSSSVPSVPDSGTSVNSSLISSSHSLASSITDSSSSSVTGSAVALEPSSKSAASTGSAHSTSPSFVPANSSTGSFSTVIPYSLSTIVTGATATPVISSVFHSDSNLPLVTVSTSTPSASSTIVPGVSSESTTLASGTLAVSDPDSTSTLRSASRLDQPKFSSTPPIADSDSRLITSNPVVTDLSSANVTNSTAATSHSSASGTSEIAHKVETSNQDDFESHIFSQIDEKRDSFVASNDQNRMTVNIPTNSEPRNIDLMAFLGNMEKIPIHPESSGENVSGTETPIKIDPNSRTKTSDPTHHNAQVHISKSAHKSQSQTSRTFTLEMGSKQESRTAQNGEKTFLLSSGTSDDIAELIENVPDHIVAIYGPDDDLANDSLEDLEGTLHGLKEAFDTPSKDHEPANAKKASGFSKDVGADVGVIGETKSLTRKFNSASFLENTSSEDEPSEDIINVPIIANGKLKSLRFQTGSRRRITDCKQSHRNSKVLEVGNSKVRPNDMTNTGSRFAKVLKTPKRKDKASCSTSQATFAVPQDCGRYIIRHKGCNDQQQIPFSIYWHTIETKPKLPYRYLKELRPFESADFEDKAPNTGCSSDCLDSYETSEEMHSKNMKPQFPELFNFHKLFTK